MSDLPPDWAIEKAKNLRASEILRADARNGFVLMHHAFARYIAEHEEAPVDPLVLEAREVVFQDHKDMNYFNLDRYDLDAGKCDEAQPVRVAMKALRRGIELGKAMS